MVTTTTGRAPYDTSALKICIVGNSNSIMREAYVRVLEQIPGATVTNKSIGATTNVVLLDFLGRETNLDYDFIIIETAVVDFLHGRDFYPRERSLETLELFISRIRAASTAQMIILTIPTRYALLDYNKHWQEDLYHDTAVRMGVPILDGFRLLRRLVGPPAMDIAGSHFMRFERLAAAFTLPQHLALSLAWFDLRNIHVPTNYLGLTAFVDHAHFSGAMHALVGSILAKFVTSTRLDRQEASVDLALPAMPPVLAVDPSSNHQLTRTSSLMSRNLSVLRDDETACYQCPPHYRAYAILVNDTKTFCFLRMKSPLGSIMFDMRFRPTVFDWTGIVVPILDPVGDGLVEVTALELPDESMVCRPVFNTEAQPLPCGAELGELICVREDWRDLFAVPEEAHCPACHLEDTDYAQLAIEEAAASAALVALGTERDGRFVAGDCSAFAASLLANGSKPLSFADRARLLLALGMIEQLPAFFEAALDQSTDHEALDKMRTALQIYRAETDAANKARPEPPASTKRPKITLNTGRPPPVNPAHGVDADDCALIKHFESLGGGGHGAEFVIFQRHFGVNTCGLLSWADIYQDRLSEVLESEFRGIGDPEFTNILAPDSTSDPEYWTTDTRYHMAMRTFIPIDDCPFERIRDQIFDRLKSFSRQLVDDLRAAEKIFVYRNMRRTLTDTEIHRLHAACRRYGRNTLLYIGYEDATHRSGTVVAKDDGLLVGYINRFSHTSDTDVFIGAATDPLLQICRNAHALWK